MITKSRRHRAEAPKKSPTLKFLEATAGRPLTLGGLLESIRLGEELSQAACAKKLGVSSSHLCDIEKGRKVVGPERAARFAAILGRSPEQLVRLSLQELVDGARLNLKVNVGAA
jgi:plasmid maintenance system antidote protein VapI